MTMISSKIRELVNVKKVTLHELAAYCSITDHGLQKMLKSNDFKTSTLLKIAEFFNVNPSVFFSIPVEKAPSLPKSTAMSRKKKVVLQIEVDENNELRMTLGQDFIKLMTR